MYKKLFGVVATAALVAGGAVVAVAGPAGAGGAPSLTPCEGEFGGNIPIGQPVIDSQTYCAELTIEKQVDQAIARIEAGFGIAP